MNYSNLLKRFPEVNEVYILVNSFELYLGTQKIKIKIQQGIKNRKYSYSNSHHYHGSKQAGPYTSSRCVMIDSELEALHGAIEELTNFYDENDYNAKWIENEDF
ncbi:hypothetical protein [Stenotrophomonas maltophilia group sp. RNC7]|uniref:hypothetical protein n=1 Tax=Stenotrophomonas maltophilia group sp. RNC7 TaxID=3071467 RepID=UPI0027DFF41B|nr:hypothetical protein [Stenotrophomonas maltophilia group sp. RNC7]MDQ4683054.1 hypothetical protein [Stenotrophomonas maltophilia group sp. RNC7]